MALVRDVLSAYAFGFGGDPMNYGDEADLQSFPGGNGGFARHMVKTLLPASIPGPRTLEAVCRGPVNFDALDKAGEHVRIRLGSTVVRVEHEGPAEHSDFVRITYTRKGKVYRLKARAVVMAGGSWTTKHIVIDLPSEQRAAYAQFFRSPCMIVNIALRNWRFLYKLGISGAFLYGGLGVYGSVRRTPTFGTKDKTIGPDSPVVMTIKVLFCRPGLPLVEQQTAGRAELLSTSFRDYERRVREQLTEMFAASGFDAKRDVAGIVLNRWGHAYCSPQPGFFFGKDGQPAPREILRRAPFGRIAFANTDLSGDPGHTTAIAEGQRAASQLLDRIVAWDIHLQLNLGCPTSRSFLARCGIHSPVFLTLSDFSHSGRRAVEVRGIATSRKKRARVGSRGSVARRETRISAICSDSYYGFSAKIASSGAPVTNPRTCVNPADSSRTRNSPRLRSLPSVHTSMFSDCNWAERGPVFSSFTSFSESRIPPPEGKCS